MNFLDSNTRDKMALIALFAFGILAFVGLFMGKDTMNILLLIIGAFSTAYKGAPGTPAQPLPPVSDGENK